MVVSSFAKVVATGITHGHFTRCDFQCFNVSVLHKAHKCFIINIGVHGKSTFPSRSLEDLDNKEQGGMDF